LSVRVSTPYYETGYPPPLNFEYRTKNPPGPKPGGFCPSQPHTSSAMEICLAEERSKLDKSVAELDMLLEVLAEKDATIDDLNANMKKLRKMGFMFGVAVVFLVAVVVGCCRIDV